MLKYLLTKPIKLYECFVGSEFLNIYLNAKRMHTLYFAVCTIFCLKKFIKNKLMKESLKNQTISCNY